MYGLGEKGRGKQRVSHIQIRVPFPDCPQCGQKGTALDTILQVYHIDSVAISVESVELAGPPLSPPHPKSAVMESTTAIGEVDLETPTPSWWQRFKNWGAKPWRRT